jgi:hypothetical protein
LRYLEETARAVDPLHGEREPPARGHESRADGTQGPHDDRGAQALGDLLGSNWEPRAAAEKMGQGLGHPATEVRKEAHGLPGAKRSDDARRGARRSSVNHVDAAGVAVPIDPGVEARVVALAHDDGRPQAKLGDGRCKELEWSEVGAHEYGAALLGQRFDERALRALGYVHPVEGLHAFPPEKEGGRQIFSGALEREKSYPVRFLGGQATRRVFSCAAKRASGCRSNRSSEGSPERKERGLGHSVRDGERRANAARDEPVFGCLEPRPLAARAPIARAGTV